MFKRLSTNKLNYKYLLPTENVNVLINPRSSPRPIEIATFPDKLRINRMNSVYRRLWYNRVFNRYYNNLLFIKKNKYQTAKRSDED